MRLMANEKQYSFFKSLDCGFFLLRNCHIRLICYTKNTAIPIITTESSFQLITFDFDVHFTMASWTFHKHGYFNDCSCPKKYYRYLNGRFYLYWIFLFGVESRPVILLWSPPSLYLKIKKIWEPTFCWSPGYMSA